MAIKTKKIGDLNIIGISDEKSVHLLGSYATETGRVALSDIFSVVDDKFSNQMNTLESTISTMVAATAQVATVDETEESDVSKQLTEIKCSIEDLASEYKSLLKKYNSFTTSVLETQLMMQDSISKLTLDCEKYESFIMSLQKDGYLTLKEIQRAAAEACPICNHTHEEEQPAE